MKRNRDLMRALLLELEACGDPTGLEIRGRFEAFQDGMIFLLHGTEARPELRERDYQLIQLEKAGLIEFVDEQRSPNFLGGRVRLLPAGHDAIDAIADESIWSRLKNSAPKEAYDIVKAAASTAGAKALSTAVGWG